MIILGVDRSDGAFEDDKKRVINYDNVYVYARSGELDKRTKQFSYSSGKWCAIYKIKTEDFLEAFGDLKNPFDEVKGLDVIPNYNEYGKIVGFIRR